MDADVGAAYRKMAADQDREAAANYDNYAARGILTT